MKSQKSPVSPIVSRPFADTSFTDISFADTPPAAVQIGHRGVHLNRLGLACALAWGALTLAACGGGSSTTTTSTTTPTTSGATSTSTDSTSTAQTSSGSTTTTGSSSSGTSSGSTTTTTTSGSTGSTSTGTTTGSTSASGTATSGSSGSTGTTTTSTATGPTIAGCQVFPATAIFNTRIDDVTQFPAHPSSAAWKSAIDSTGSRRLHLDWGTNEDQTQHSSYYGIPYNVMDGSTVPTTWPVATYSGGVPDESDCAVPNGSGGYKIQRGCSATSNPRLPIPTDATVKIEGGYCPVGQTCPDGDHHILVLEKATCRLWEAYYAGGSAEQSVNGSWNLYGSAAWDLNSLVQRPAGWTSVDAAGLPVLPLLARFDEANAGEVKHALRITLRSGVMARANVWPARHQAGQSGPIPFGALLRLRADFVIPSTWTTQAKALATAMKRYGVYVADNGSDMYIQGEPSAQWQDATWSQLQSITLSQFDFVSLDSITSRAGFNPDSLAATW